MQLNGLTSIQAQQQKEQEFPDTIHHFHPFEILTDSHRRKHHHQDDSDQVLDD